VLGTVLASVNMDRAPRISMSAFRLNSDQHQGAYEEAGLAGVHREPGTAR